MPKKTKKPPRRRNPFAKELEKPLFRGRKLERKLLEETGPITWDEWRQILEEMESNEDD
jgi:hypothetical protein